MARASGVKLTTRVTREASEGRQDPGLLRSVSAANNHAGHQDLQGPSLLRCGTP